MNTVRKLIGMLLVIAFALSSGASFGADKQYILTAATSTATPAPAFTFTFTNDGNSSFNSLTLNLPGGWTLAAAGGATSSRGVATINAARNVVTVNGINLPTGAGQFMTVTVTGVTGAVSCSPQSGNWTAQPWTGTPVGSGNKFNPKPSSTYPVSTTLPASCFTVTSSVGSGSGSISPLGAQTVSVNAQPSFTLTPVTGNHVTTVGGTCPAGSFAGNVYTTGAIVGDCTVIANFAVDTFTVSTSFDATKGTMSPTSRTGVAYGTTTTFDVAPLAGFHTTSVSGCGVGTPVGITYTTAAITAACTVSAAFAPNKLSITAPDTAYIGTPLSVPVGYDGPNPANIVLGWSCTSESGSTTITAPTSTPVNFSVTLAKTGSCTFTASAPNYQSASASTSTPVYTGTLGCVATDRKGGTLDPSALKSYVKASEQGQWGLLRGSNKDSTGCVVVPYVFEVDVISNPQVAKFIAPDSSVTPFQKVSAKYTVVWGRFDVVGDGTNIWATKRPKLSWGIAAPVPGTDDFVPALPCVIDPDNPDLASTYPNGFVSVPTSDLDKLLPVIPNVAPFNDPAVTDTRPQYKADGTNKAKMCVTQQGWTATGSDTPSNPLVGTPTTVQIWTSIIDQADGWAAIDQ